MFHHISKHREVFWKNEAQIEKKVGLIYVSSSSHIQTPSRCWFPLFLSYELLMILDVWFKAASMQGKTARIWWVFGGEREHYRQKSRFRERKVAENLACCCRSWRNIYILTIEFKHLLSSSVSSSSVFIRSISSVASMKDIYVLQTVFINSFNNCRFGHNVWSTIKVHPNISFCLIHHKTVVLSLTWMVDTTPVQISDATLSV